MRSVPPTRPSPRTTPHITRGPGVSRSPVRTEPSATKVGESPIWSISLRLMVSLIRCSLECAGVIIRKVRRLGRPIMLTFGAGRVALIVVLALLAAGCSRRQQDWRCAEAAETGEAYARFVEQYPDTELAVQARARLAQLDEERDWAQAGKIATADAYRALLPEHPTGSWSGDARLPIPALSLGATPPLAPPPPAQRGGAPHGAPA